MKKEMKEKTLLKSKLKQQTRGPGAPVKRDEEKVLPNGLRPDQWERLQEEAEIRGISAAKMQRDAIDWFITVLDTKRSDVTTSAKFDDVLKTPMDGE